jgi:hypothetical protein
MTATDNPVRTRPPADAAGVDRPKARGATRLIERLDPADDFNFRHFRMRHMAAELLRSACPDGVLPGDEAPDFELETTGAEKLRLRELRGRPVLLHFVSYT